jgi:hypothetical protein
MDKQKIEEILDRLSFYHQQYQQLRTRVPRITVKELNDPLRKNMIKWIREKTWADSVYVFMEGQLLFVDAVFYTLDTTTKANLLHQVLKELDRRFANRWANNKLLLEGPVGKNGDLYLKPARFWKKKEEEKKEEATEQGQKGKPLPSFSKGFRSFGAYHPGYPARIIRLDDLSDEHHFESGTVDFLEKTTALRIGLFPLTKDYRISFRMTDTLDEEDGTQGFLANPNKTGSFVPALDEAISIIEKEDIHIACFPELSICKPALDHLRTACRAMKEKEFLVLIGGSFHKVFRHSPTGQQDEYKNTIPIYFYFNGVEHLLSPSYSKLEPFTVEVNDKTAPFLKGYFDELKDGTGYSLEEDIEPDVSLLLMTSKKFGDIGFVICKDFLSDKSELIRNYESLADHLFIVSLDVGGKSDFRGRAEHLALEHGIAVFYTNARCFDPGNHSPSFYSIPQFVDDKLVMDVVGVKAPVLQYTLAERKII